MDKIDKCYLKDDFTLVNVKIEDKTYEYYENDSLIKKGATKKIKDFSLPIEPTFTYNHLILSDYNRGVEIIGDNTYEFLRVTSVYHFCYYENILAFIRQKLVTIYDLKTHQIIKEFNCNSENCKVAQFKQYLLFYKKYRSTSYLYDMKSCSWSELGNFKIDGLLNRISIEDNLLYIFASKEIAIFDLNTKKVARRIPLNYRNCDICKYSFSFDITPKKGVELKEEYTTKDIHSYLFHKFGIITFITLTDINLVGEFYGNDVAEKVRLLSKTMSWHVNPISTYAEFQAVKEKIEQTALELRELI